MMQWFRQLETREQAVLTFGVLFVLLWLGWNLLWTPLALRSTDLSGVVADKTELVVDLRRAAGLSSAGPAARNAGANTSLTVIINLTAEPLGLVAAIERSSLVGGGDAIRVSLRGAPFDTLIRWLDVLEGEYGVAVATADLARTAQAGTINGQIVLERT